MKSEVIVTGGEGQTDVTAGLGLYRRRWERARSTRAHPRGTGAQHL